MIRRSTLSSVTPLINKIDGTRYAQNVPYEITCDSTVRDETMAMTLTLSGSVSDFNPAA